MKKNNKFIYLISLFFIFSCYNDSISKRDINLFNTQGDFHSFDLDAPDVIDKIILSLKEAHKEYRLHYLPYGKLVQNDDGSIEAVDLIKKNQLFSRVSKKNKRFKKTIYTKQTVDIRKSPKTGHTLSKIVEDQIEKIKEMESQINFIRNPFQYKKIILGKAISLLDSLMNPASFSKTIYRLSDKITSHLDELDNLNPFLLYYSKKNTWARDLISNISSSIRDSWGSFERRSILDNMGEFFIEEYYRNIKILIRSIDSLLNPHTLDSSIVNRSIETLTEVLTCFVSLTNESFQNLNPTDKLRLNFIRSLLTDKFKRLIEEKNIEKFRSSYQRITQRFDRDHQDLTSSFEEPSMPDNEIISNSYELVNKLAETILNNPNKIILFKGEFVCFFKEGADLISSVYGIIRDSSYDKEEAVRIKSKASLFVNKKNAIKVRDDAHPVKVNLEYIKHILQIAMDEYAPPSL